MDRFLFHNEQYRILDAVKGESWAGVPLPFVECAFEFLDSGLHVNSYVLQGGGVLRTTYSQTASEQEYIPLGCAEVLLIRGRWPEKLSIKAWNGMAAPPDCVYEFLRFYQRLSVYLAQPKRVAELPVLEGTETAYRATERPNGEMQVHTGRERIISLEPLTEVEKRIALQVDPQERRKQQHPCDYEYWVRGHTRHYKSGVVAWVKPFQKNKGKPAKSKTYSLSKGEGL